MAASAAFSGWQPDGPAATRSLPDGAVFIEQGVRNGDRKARVLGVFFSEKHATLAVVDNPGPGRKKLSDLARQSGAIAGVNGGYFHENWMPVGLEIAGGETVHGFEKATLLSGLLVVTGGRPRLLRPSEYTPSKRDTQALQAGPYLVDGGKPTAGLSARPPARRTVVATDGGGRWAVLYLSFVSLAEAGEILSAPGILPDFRVERALNLDGGSSSAIWADTDGGTVSFPEPWPVRNYLLVLPRSK